MPTIAWVMTDISRLAGAYAYVTFATMAVLGGLGFLLGRLFDAEHVLSITDPLTGLFNRRHFERHLVKEKRRALRYGRSLSVVCIDIDHLKAINDSLGHKAGDSLILGLSRTLLKNVRTIDVVARLGGDEFAVLLPETPIGQASTLCQRILTEVAMRGSSAWDLSISMGIAEWNPTEASKHGDPLSAADCALYRAKEGGGNRFVVARVSDQRAKPTFHVTLLEAASFARGN